MNRATAGESSAHATAQRHSTAARTVERTGGQLGIPTDVTPEEIAREQSFGGSIDLCAKVAGYTLDKNLTLELGLDKAQFSRWQNGTEGVTWPKLRRLMELCGNNAPVLWMLHQLGYDLHSLRMRETETERALRIANARIAELEREREITLKVMREVRA